MSPSTWGYGIPTGEQFLGDLKTGEASLVHALSLGYAISGEELDQIQHQNSDMSASGRKIAKSLGQTTAAVTAAAGPAYVGGAALACGFAESVVVIPTAGYFGSAGLGALIHTGFFTAGELFVMNTFMFTTAMGGARPYMILEEVSRGDYEAAWGLFDASIVVGLPGSASFNPKPKFMGDGYGQSNSDNCKK